MLITITKVTKNVGPRRRVECESPTLVGEENKRSFIRYGNLPLADAF